MEEINENTTSVITLVFKDEDLHTVTPTSAAITLYDKFSGVIRRSEALSGTALSGTIDIELTPTNNRIINQNNRYEIATLYVEFGYDDRIGSGEYSYKILNLAPVT